MSYLANWCSQPTSEEKIKKAKKKQPTMLPLWQDLRSRSRTRPREITKKNDEEAGKPIFKMAGVTLWDWLHNIRPYLGAFENWDKDGIRVDNNRSSNLH